MSRKRVPLNQNGCTVDFRIGVPFEQNLHFTLLEILQESVASPFQSVIILDVCNYLIIKEISAEQLSDIELHNTTKVSTPFSK